MKTSDLTKAQQTQLDEAKEMVKVQQYALDQIEKPLKKLANDEKLSTPEQRTMAVVLRWTDEETQAFLDQSKEDRKIVVDRILAPPFVYFYVGHDKDGQNPTHRVYVTGEGVEFQDSEHSDF